MKAIWFIIKVVINFSVINGRSNLVKPDLIIDQKGCMPRLLYIVHDEVKGYQYMDALAINDLKLNCGLIDLINLLLN